MRQPSDLSHISSLRGSEEPLIEVSVTYATPERNWLVHVTLETNASIAQAIQSSQFLAEFKEFKLEQLVTGIYGIRAPLTQKLNDGDRVEIYRPLTFDPKQSRRRRAIHRQKIRNIKKKMPINDVTI